MAVRTIVLSRQGSNLARPVIIHDIIHGLIYVPNTPCCRFFVGFAGWKLRLRPLRFFYVQLKVSQTSHLIDVVLWAPRVYTALSGTPHHKQDNQYSRFIDLYSCPYPISYHGVIRIVLCLNIHTVQCFIHIKCVDSTSLHLAFLSVSVVVIPVSPLRARGSNHDHDLIG